MRLFLIVPDSLGKLDGKLFSPLASLRLRCLEIAPYLAALGYRPRLVIDRDVHTMTREGSFLEADAYINFKTTFNLENYLYEAVNRGKPVIVDMCDNVFEGPDAVANESLLSIATLATASTQPLATLIEDRGAAVRVIPDCLEGMASTSPAPAPESQVRLLWFGRRQNAGPLLANLGDLSVGKEATRHLTVVCDDGLGLADEIQTLVPSIAVSGVEWSPSALDEALASCHIVVTPMSDAPIHLTKSANRLAHALWRNRPVVTHDFPGLEWLTEYVTVADNLDAGIERARQDWARTLERTRLGQRATEQKLHPKVIAKQWSDALVLARELVTRQKPPVQSRHGVRLNLGCGDKLLPHYINIDAAPIRDGRQPDLICDACDLTPFADNSVDEVLSVHLIEHIFPGEVPNAISEWIRVLKPGGRLVIECPNLLSACEALVNMPEAAMESTGEAAQRTMWAFYGDPVAGDPLMTHKWGYTPQSLSRLLRDAGLRDVLSESPKFKLGEPRDMRVAGMKAPLRDP